MKLKYYLRGLGIGMLTAALVLIISGNAGARMSDEAVKRRAAQLGMVEKDTTVLDDIGGEAAEESAGTDTLSEPSGTGTIPENTEAEETESGEDTAEQTGETAPGGDTETQAGEVESEEKVEQGEESAAEADAEKRALVQEIEQRADDVADRAEEAAENSVPEKTVRLDVRRGDSSISVARRAAEAGLVQSAADFDVFLCSNGYDKRISIGSYEIAEGASEKEIAEIITRSR